jgi:hypothetical protein
MRPSFDSPSLAPELPAAMQLQPLELEAAG